MNSFSPCTQFAEPSPVGDSIVFFYNTTPTRFDELVKLQPKYKLMHADNLGRTTLSRAAMYGNIELISHIANLAGKTIVSLINLGDKFGTTPLEFALRVYDPYKNKSLFLIVNKLLELGANINIIDTTVENNYVTPLWSASEMPNIKVIKLLLSNGGAIHPKVLERNTSERICGHHNSIAKALNKLFKIHKMIELAKQQSIEEKKGQISEKPCSFAVLPIEIIDYISVLNRKMNAAGIFKTCKSLKTHDF